MLADCLFSKFSTYFEYPIVYKSNLYESDAITKMITFCHYSSTYKVHIGIWKTFILWEKSNIGIHVHRGVKIY